MSDTPAPLDFAALMEQPQIKALLEAVEEVLEDFRCSEPSDSYVPIEEALLGDLWAAFQPFDAARSPGGLLGE